MVRQDFDIENIDAPAYRVVFPNLLRNLRLSNADLNCRSTIFS